MHGALETLCVSSQAPSPPSVIQITAVLSFTAVISSACFLVLCTTYCKSCPSLVWNKTHLCDLIADTFGEKISILHKVPEQFSNKL